ncbi:hypothetical protein KEM60_02394 [Austwickia sp. TVS 96-490-7B]|uniref:hypothetical protein n=1 Tax=Austwickia sp. TVS 96-490-7B TaxID=2830843 RepID=UPI001C58695E|nr:hypothetical protein [Austwickia sp. TVS 96-490-7B]MBW3086183.1 hypothetical protein [Austwickia sp. TVS 96-490-7B]
MSTDSATPQFATVFRGFDPGQVESALAGLRESVATAREESARAQARLDAVRQERDDVRTRLATAERKADTQDDTIRDLRDQLAQVHAQLAQHDDLPTEDSPSSFVHLGKRVGQILSLAEAEATSLVMKATTEADRIRQDATDDGIRTRRAAEQYATETRERADTDAEQTLMEAKESSATLVDDAIRDAAARREEAEAYFERQRALASEAAAEFEQTLGQRREKATREFQSELASQEEELRRLTDRITVMRTDAEQERTQAAEESALRLSEAKAQAQEMVDTARSQAERIRRESERELAAAMARRDSITSQLSNVRSMLATFGLGTGVADDPLRDVNLGDITMEEPATAATPGYESPTGPTLPADEVTSAVHDQGEAALDAADAVTPTRASSGGSSKRRR